MIPMTTVPRIRKQNILVFIVANPPTTAFCFRQPGGFPHSPHRGRVFCRAPFEGFARGCRFFVVIHAPIFAERLATAAREPGEAETVSGPIFRILIPVRRLTKTGPDTVSPRSSVGRKAPAVPGGREALS